MPKNVHGRKKMFKSDGEKKFEKLMERDEAQSALILLANILVNSNIKDTEFQVALGSDDGGVLKINFHLRIDEIS